MKDTIYKRFTTSAHAYLEVPIQHILNLGIENDISDYSIIKNDIVYLERSSDEEKFINAYRNQMGIEPNTLSLEDMSNQVVPSLTYNNQYSYSKINATFK